MTTLNKVFKFLELSERAKHIYSLIINRGEISAAVLAEELELPRTTVYLELTGLEKLGLISTIGSYRKQKFTAENPDALTELVKSKMNHAGEVYTLAQEAAQILNAQILAQRGWGMPSIKFFRGVEGVKRVLKMTNQTKSKELIGINPAYDLYKILGGKFLNELTQERVKKNIRVRNIWPKEKIPVELAEHQKQLREMKFSGELGKFHSSIIVYDDVVILITSTQELLSIQIKSQDLAETMCAVFELLWKDARKK
ncbi:MAG: helix-turn-helix domain-containing protein [Patescibacteria group bacterium]